MKVRAAASGLVALIVLGVTLSVGVAEAKESTTTVKVKEAGISLVHPASWKVTTNELVAKDDAFYRKNPEIARDAQPTTRFGAQARRRTRAGQLSSLLVETTEVDPTFPVQPEPSLNELRDAQRDAAKYMGADFRLLGVSKHKVGSDIAIRSDFVYGSKSHRERKTEFGFTMTSFVHDGPSGPRNVLVTVYAPFDAEGKAAIDHILGSVKPIAVATNTTPGATDPAVTSSAKSVPDGYHKVTVDNAGFGIAVPDAWRALDLTRQDIDHAYQLLREALPGLAANLPKDASALTAQGVKLIAQDPSLATPHNVNVILLSFYSSLPTPDEIRTRLTGLPNLEVTETSVAGIPAVVATGTLPRGTTTLHSTSYFVLGKYGLLQIGFGTAEDGRQDPTVQTMIGSLELLPPT